MRFAMRHTGIALALGVLGVFSIAGCGTTRSSDSMRTGTEQLLISDAIDRAVDGLDFDLLAGHAVFLDDRPIQTVTDKDYVSSCVRQQLLASGCVLKQNREEADFVVELRAGAVGTDRHELLFGIPAFQVPQISPLAGAPSAVPEIPFAKRREQRGIAKLAVFAYHRATGEPIWQSGMLAASSTADDLWFLGAGPFQKGTIYDGNDLGVKDIAGALRIEDKDERGQPVRLASEAVFTWPEVLEEPELPAYACTPPSSEPVKLPPPANTGTDDPSVVPASHEAPSTPLTEPELIAPF